MILYYDPHEQGYLCKCGLPLDTGDAADAADLLPDDQEIDQVWAAREDHPGDPAAPLEHDVLVVAGPVVRQARVGGCAAADPATIESARSDTREALLRYDTARHAFLCTCGTPLRYMDDYPTKGVAMLDPDAIWAASEADIVAAVGGQPRHDVLQADFDVINWAARGSCRGAAA